MRSERLKYSLLGQPAGRERFNLLGRATLAYSSTARLRWQGLVFNLVAVAASTAIMFWLQVAPYNVNMVFMLLTLITTVWYGLASGVITAVLGFLCFDFFFLPPLFTFIIDAFQGWFAVFLFLGTALFANQVAGRARLSSQAAQQRAQEAGALYELARAMLTRVDQKEMLLVVLQKAAQVLGTTTCTLYLAEPPSGALIESIRVEGARVVTSKGPEGVRHPDPALAQAVFSQARPLYYPASFAEGATESYPVAYLPLTYGAETLGVLGIVGQIRDERQPADFSAEEKRIIGVFTNHIALAVEHVRLIEEAAQLATLREADKLKTALLDSVSHELRTPLTSIKTATANLQSVDIEWTAEEREEMLELIEQETNRLSRLVSNLLELSKIEGHALKPDWGWYYLPEIVEQVAGRLKHNPLFKTHPIQLQFGPDLPLTRLDYLQLDQVLTNLLDNAAKYSATGQSITVQVEVQPACQVHKPGDAAALPNPEQSMLIVSVLDEGRGIPQAELERIFDKFYRVRPKTESLIMDTPGTGIGLAISKGIIEAHGGQIWAENRLYGGSVFRFTLPVVAETTEEE